MKNRRLLAIIVLAIVALACVTAAAACEPPELPEYDMSGITFANGTVSYDGQAHTLEVTGTLPEGVTVAYEYYSGETKLSSAPVNAGEYRVVAKFTGDNEHKAITDKTATLTITTVDYTLDVTLADKTVTYNGQAHTLEVTGALPAGVTVAYEYYKGETKLSSAPVNGGTYKVVAKFTGDGSHNAIADKTATLTINKANLELTLGAILDADSNPLDKAVEFLKHEDGSYSTFVASDTTYSIAVLKSNVPVDCRFYNKLNEDNTVDTTSLAAGTLSRRGEVKYALVSIRNTADKENYNDNVVVKISGTNRVVEIRTYEDLLQLSSDVEVYSPRVRIDTVYKLMNDIDCGGKVWQTISTLVPTGSNEEVPYQVSFLSELDGQGHKIYNFKLTDESVRKENITALNGIALGFFGFLSDAKIHDVTFSDVTVDFDVARLADKDKYGDNAYEWTTKSYIYFGVIAGRVNINDFFKEGTYISNVKVENVNTVNLTVTHSFVGTFFGWDSGMVGGSKAMPVRSNLQAKNINITVKQKVNMMLDERASVFMGGFVGGTFTYIPLVYTDCSATDIHLTLDRDIDGVTAVNEQYVGGGLGGFVGWHYNMLWSTGTQYDNANDGFTNCTLKNYLLENKSNYSRDYNGLQCAYEAESNKSMISCIDCKFENDSDGDYGMFRYLWDNATKKFKKYVYVDRLQWTHVCTSVCEICGKCTDVNCTEPECADKCLLHGDEHICLTQCPICHKCLNPTCQEPHCKDKCPDNHTGDELLKYDLSGVTFADREITYDGNDQTIVIGGADLPEGVTVSYTYYKGTVADANKLPAGELPRKIGTYKVVATFTGDKWHKVEEKIATLTINKLNYDTSNVTFEDTTVTYDGQPHTIPLSGLPAGVTLNPDYLCYKCATAEEISDANKLPAGQLPVEAGTYILVAQFTGSNEDYNPVPDMTAKLTIEKATYTHAGELKDKTVTYNGESHSLVYTGASALPEGIAVSYEYRLGETKLPDNELPVNAGVYTVTAKFTVNGNYNAVVDLTAKLTVETLKVNASLGATENASGTAFGGTVKFHPLNSDTWRAFFGADDFASYKVAILDCNVTDYTVKYYTSVEATAEVTVNGGSLSAANTVYLRIVPNNIAADNYDSPVITVSGVTPTTSKKAVVEIRTYDDLLLIYSDSYILPSAIKENMIYRLMNDIDCGGKVWKTVGPISIGDNSVTDQLHGKRSFDGELDGNNHVIKNFQITNDSIDKEDIPLHKSFNNGSEKKHYALALGFFGYVDTAKVHNVTFDSIKVRIDQEDLGPATPSTWTGNSHFDFGVVAGYVATSWVGEFRDITVSNLDAVLNLGSGRVGTFFGVDSGRDPNSFKNSKWLTERKNLVGSNINIRLSKNYFVTGAGAGEFALGGFVGALVSECPVYYENCALSNVTLKVSSYPQRGSSDRVHDGYLGGFVGIHDTVEWADWSKDVTVKNDKGEVTEFYPAMKPELLHDKFDNCSISNYMLINDSCTATKDYTDLYCGLERAVTESAKYRKEVQLFNCTASLDDSTNPNYGIQHNVYNKTTNSVDEYVCTGSRNDGNNGDGNKQWTPKTSN